MLLRRRFVRSFTQNTSFLSYNDAAAGGIYSDIKATVYRKVVIRGNDHDPQYAGDEVLESTCFYRS